MRGGLFLLASVAVVVVVCVMLKYCTTQIECSNNSSTMEILSSVLATRIYIMINSWPDQLDTKVFDVVVA